MDKIKMIFCILHQKIKSGVRNIHIIFFFVYVWFLCDLYLRPIRTLIHSTGVEASPYGIIFLMDQRNFVLLFFLGIAFAFSDLPFVNKATKYTVLRTGVPIWTVSQICYLWLGSVFLTIISVGISLIPLIGQIVLQDGWGKIYGTLAQTTAGEVFGISLQVSYQIILDYTPIEALLYVFVILILLSCLIGKVLFLFGLWYKRVIGTTIVVGMILFSAVLDLLGGYKPLFFSPISWVSLSNLTEFRGNGLPIFQDVFVTLLLLHIVLSVIIYRKSYKEDFNC